MGIKSCLICMVLTFCMLFTGCQYQKEKKDVLFSNQVTSIEVIEWYDGRSAGTITDSDFIDRLVEALKNAESSSTATYDFPDPNFQLVFYHDDEKLLELGYYNEIMKLGVHGRYISFDEDIIYGVTLKIPELK